jgi:hypothetical protein
MTKLNDEFKIFNITIVREFMELLSQFNMKLFPKFLKNIAKNYSKDGERIERFNTRTVLKIINHLPPEYTNLKFIDESCSPLKMNTTRLKGSDLKTVLKNYRTSMISENPTSVKGGTGI